MRITGRNTRPNISRRPKRNTKKKCIISVFQIVRRGLLLARSQIETETPKPRVKVLQPLPSVIMADAAGAPLEVEYKSRPRKKGKFSFKDGSSYEGQWVDYNGKKVREGQGFFRHPEGTEEYDGNWLNDVMHGTGTLRFISGAVYEGSFKDGVFEGEGSYSFPDGSTYKGQWVNNVWHGEGEYIDKHSRKFAGTFVHGNFNSSTTYSSLEPPDFNLSQEVKGRQLIGGNGQGDSISNFDLGDEFMDL